MTTPSPRPGSDLLDAPRVPSGVESRTRPGGKACKQTLVYMANARASAQNPASGSYG